MVELWKILASGRYQLTGTTGRGHLSYDIWISPTNVQAKGNDTGAGWTELMIPLKSWGNYGEVGDRNPGWDTGVNVTIGGVPFRIYKVVGGVGPWNFLVYQHTAAVYPLDVNSQFTVDISAIIQHASSIGYMVGNYLASIELGVEMVWGNGDCTIYNYKVNG